LDRSISTTKDDKTSGPSGSLTLTGKLGDVMKESCKIALTYAKSFLHQIDPDNRSLRIGHIHVHVPEVIIIKEIDCFLFYTFFYFILGSNTKRWSVRWLYNCYSTSITCFE